MGRIIDIRTGDRAEHLALAVEWIRSGYVIAVPLENGYAFVADAFTHDAVRAMHVLRGDELGVAAQVLISSGHVLDGIARGVSAQARILMDAFWPGLLTFILTPHRGLSWDLGDNRELDEISVRVPNSEFILDLLKKTGPLAVASAAPSGHPPILSAQLVQARESDLAGIFDQGEIAESSASTIVSDSEIEILLRREGAISLEQLREFLPDIRSHLAGESPSN